MEYFTQTLLSNRNGDSMKPPLQMFWRSALFDELCTLEDMLVANISMPKKTPSIGEGDWQEFMTNLLADISEAATDIHEISLPTLHPSAAGKALRWRLRQAQFALGPLPQPGTAAYPPAGILPSHEVLLPMRLKDRLRLLLGFAELPMVWVRAIDVTTMPAPQTRPDRPE